MAKDNYNICESKTFESIYNTHANEVRRFLFFKTQSIDKAEDLLQEAFIKLWDNCSKVDFNKVKSYIYTVANNLFLNDVKHLQNSYQNCNLQHYYNIFHYVIFDYELINNEYMILNHLL